MAAAAATERFLLTGGGGFIGSWVVKNLLRRGAAVGSLDIDVSVSEVGV